MVPGPRARFVEAGAGAEAGAGGVGRGMLANEFLDLNRSPLFILRLPIVCMYTDIDVCMYVQYVRMYICM